MSDFDLETTLQAVFTKIQLEQMSDIPILNPMIDVETVGFQNYLERKVGILITPWMMSLVMFPAENDDWSALAIGDKRTLDFPSGPYEFMINDVEGIGPYLTHSIHSPMKHFHNQEQALAVARRFLQNLMTEPQTEEQSIDEESLRRIVQGEKVGDPAANGELTHGKPGLENDAQQTSVQDNRPPEIYRRDLLRGKFS